MRKFTVSHVSQDTAFISDEQGHDVVVIQRLKTMLDANDDDYFSSNPCRDEEWQHIIDKMAIEDKASELLKKLEAGADLCGSGDLLGQLIDFLKKLTD